MQASCIQSAYFTEFEFLEKKQVIKELKKNKTTQGIPFICTKLTVAKICKTIPQTARMKGAGCFP